MGLSNPNPLGHMTSAQADKIIELLTEIHDQQSRAEFRAYTKGEPYSDELHEQSWPKGWE